MSRQSQEMRAMQHLPLLDRGASRRRSKTSDRREAHMTPHKPATLSTGQAASALNVDRTTIHNWIQSGKIRAELEQYGSRTYYRIPQGEVDRLLKTKTPAQPVVKS
jgi:excisionase family DNA binding protein